MNAGQRSARQLVSRSGRPATSSICESCRRFASAAAPVEAPAPDATIPPVVKDTAPQEAYQVSAGLLLSRPPVLTRDLHPFEKAFYLYQRRLNERLALGFTRYFYYPKNTPGDIEWKRKIKLRKTIPREIGNYNAYINGWNDEALTGAKESEPDHQREAIFKDADDVGITGPEELNKKEPLEMPQSRLTEADKLEDRTSLNRKLSRTLYLLVRERNGEWRFPQDQLKGKEPLQWAAERLMVQTGGINMNTWLVANHPVGHFEETWSTKDPKRQEVERNGQKLQQIGEKVFFMRARIMAGQADLAAGALGFTEFKWLTKEEIEKRVREYYWRSVRDMLASR
ncbi:mitochondrial 54S ribosomal protein mL46 [Phyllosticta citribraziliensis]|uniref:Large ribosomal subunit protein mL46 n=1 Tax=Phyllosticta citribraziliensis TaxID=989973 RepID=A0ABR1L4V2_9PEZI